MTVQVPVPEQPEPPQPVKALFGPGAAVNMTGVPEGYDKQVVAHGVTGVPRGLAVTVPDGASAPDLTITRV